MERNQIHVRHKRNPDVKRTITRANLANNDKDWEADPDFGSVPQIEKKNPVVSRAVAETVIYKKPVETITTSESPFVKVIEEVKEEIKEKVKTEEIDPVLFNLRKEYETRTGKPAKKNWKLETLTAKIKELPE